MIKAMLYNLAMSTVVEAPPAARVRYDIQKALTLFGGDKRAFADHLGISLTYLYELLRHKYSPSDEVFAQICIAVGKQPSEFVYLDAPA